MVKVHVSFSVADPGFSRGGGVNPPGGAWTRQIFPKTAWNRKNLDAQGGGVRPSRPPLDPPMILMSMRVRCTGLNFIAHYNVIIVNDLLLNFHNDEWEINIKEKNRRRIKGESHALELYAFVNWTIVTDGPRPSQSAATLWWICVRIMQTNHVEVTCIFPFF